MLLGLQVDATVGERPSWEVFYACPSATTAAFFQAAAELSPAADAGVPATTQLAALAELAGAVQVTLHSQSKETHQNSSLKVSSHAWSCWG